MSQGSWAQVIVDYQRLQKRSIKGVNSADYVWMEKLVSRLLEKRDLSMLYPVTSHTQLFACIGENLYEQFEKPLISIQLNHPEPIAREEFKDKFRYEISLHILREDGELRRRSVESIWFSFEKSLEVFDEMFTKLEAATNSGAQKIYYSI